jgi:hypothetical protein
MTLRWAEGFEDMTSINDFSQYFDNFSFSRSGGQNALISTTLGRGGGHCIYWPGSVYGAEYFNKNWPSGVQNGWAHYVGFAIMPNYINNDTATIALIHGSAGSGDLMRVNLNMDYTLTWKGTIDNGTDAATIGTYGQCREDTWHYIEMGCIIDSTNGYFWGRLDDTEVMSWGPGDTWSSSYYPNRFADYARFYVGSYCFWRLDDLYMADNQGSYNNSFLGSVRVDSIRPNGAGNYTQLTPSAGSNYQCVDDPHYDDTDYVEADTDGEKDTYAFPNVPTDLDDSNIKGVLVGGQSQRTEENPNVKIRHMLRTGSSDYYGSAGDTLGDTYDFNYHVFERDPSDSGAWTKAKINACEFGMELEKT